MRTTKAVVQTGAGHSVMLSEAKHLALYGKPLELFAAA